MMPTIGNALPYIIIASYLVAANKTLAAVLEHLGKVVEHDFLQNMSVACYDDGRLKQPLSRFVGSGFGAGQCKETCEKSNYRYAERRRKDECWCGNHFHAKYRKVRNCDCYGETVETRKGCVFRLHHYDYARDADENKARSTQRNRHVKKHGRKKEMGMVVNNCKPIPAGYSGDIQFTMPLNFNLGDKNHLLENPILEAAFELIVKDWLNECQAGTETFLYTHSSPSSSKRNYGDAGSLRTTQQSGQGKGTCNGHYCPSDIEISFPDFTRILTNDDELNEASGCSVTLLDRLHAYEQPPTISEGFQQVTELTVEGNSTNVEKCLWDPEDCGSDCLSRESQRNTIEAIYSYYNISYEVDSHECTWRGIACDKDLWIYRIVIENHSSLNGNKISESRGNLIDSRSTFNGKTIPEAFGDLSDLEDITLVNSGLVGNIPTSIGKLSKLIFLDFSSNNLSGEIPSEFGDLSDVEFIQLQNNVISGTIPVELRDIPLLGYLDISNNKLTGTVHEALCDKAITNGNSGLSNCPAYVTEWSKCDHYCQTYRRYLTGLWVKQHNNVRHGKAESKDEPAYLRGEQECQNKKLGNIGSSAYAKCDPGYYVKGLQTRQGDRELKKMKCCKPKIQSDAWGKCYDQSVSFNHDSEGHWQRCEDGYYVAGFQEYDCDELTCVNKFYCCQMGRVDVRKYKRGKCRNKEKCRQQSRYPPRKKWFLRED